MQRHWLTLAMVSPPSGRSRATVIGPPALETSVLQRPLEARWRCVRLRKRGRVAPLQPQHSA